MNYKGIIIEESLENADVLKDIKILETKVVPIKEKHKTPWVKQWTLHTVEIPEDQAEKVAKELSQAIDPKHQNAWYADFKNETTHFIIFRGKVFQVDRRKAEQYNKAIKYGLSLGIPDYQLSNFEADKLVET